MANPTDDEPSSTGRSPKPKASPGLTSPATKAAARKAAAAAKAAPADGSDDGKANRPTHRKLDAKAAARSGDPKKKAAATEEASRYTAPIPNSYRVSPWYIPAMMFGFLGVGMLVIILNYVSWPFGSPSNWRLLIGLACILAGILTATRYQ